VGQRPRRESRTGTHLLANLNFPRSTLTVPFCFFGAATFAQRLRKLRMQRGLTQKQLAVEAGLSKDLVWRWEGEFAGARRRSVERVAAVLGVSADHLLGGAKSAEQTGSAQRPEMVPVVSRPMTPATWG
jgi:DNA-binding XRE family transcriptional regulator